MPKWIYILFLTLLPLAGAAATIQGKVTDTRGEPLPFATVFVKGTTIGTSCNAAGDYLLHLDPGNFTVVCQYMGFRQQSFTVSLKGDEKVSHDFRLEDQSLEIKEVVVKASEDPALYIMRKVIAKRRFYADQIKTFETGIYLKGVFRTRQTPGRFMGQKIDAADMGLDSTKKGILYLCEEVATYYRQEAKQRTVIHSVRESGDPNGMGFSQFPPVINIYDNNIRIASNITPRGVISPVSENALFYYQYRLEGDFSEDGRTIFKIRVRPKRLYEPLFDGTLYIVDNEWSVHSLSLLTTKKSNLEFLDTLRLEQVYLPLNQDSWVIKQQMLYATIKIFGFDMVGNFVTVYNDQKINHRIPDSVFGEKVISVYDKGANKKDTSYWSGTRPVPLQEDEQRDYVRKDSLRVVSEDPRYRDSVRRRNNRFDPMDLVLYGYSYTGRNDKFTIRTNSLATSLLNNNIPGIVNYNTVEGLNIAPRFSVNYNIDSFHSVYSTIAIRHGFGNAHTNAIARITYWNDAQDWKGRNWFAGAEGGKYVYQLNPANPVDPLFNTVATLFYRLNYLKLYERWNAALFFGRNLGNGLRWSVEAGFQRRLPLENVTDFSFRDGKTGGFSDNLPPEFSNTGWTTHHAVIARAKLSYQPGITYTQYPEYKMPNGSRWPVFHLSYDKGVPGLLDSKTDFDKWRFGIRDYIGLKLLGSLNYNIATGGFINNRWAGIPDLNHINGNQMFVAAPYLESFQFAPYYKYSNAESFFAEAHLEWHLRGFLTNKIPLFRQMRWYLVAGTNTYYVNTDRNYVEAFVGLDNLGFSKFRMLRLDFVQTWDAGKQHSYGFRLGLNTGAIRFTGTEPGAEW